MPMNRSNTRTFTRKLFAGMLEPVRIHKRDDDQLQGTVTTYILYDCRRSLINKTGEQIQGEMTSDHQCIWHIPRREMDRVGIRHFNSADKVEQIKAPEIGRWWQPEATTYIDEKMFGNEVDLHCLRIDPPA